MSIGNLGSAGDQFRDFLGGNQHDIGVGLQAILSNYANPDGNFIRLEDRAYGMFQLSNAEYQAVFDQDAQNQFAETWYAEYRAVLLLRAEALKKKLNRSYSRVLENSIYAPLRPGEKWAPQANRDVNDIDATDPLKFFSGGSIVGPPIPSNVEVDVTKYAHPDWFSGTTAPPGPKLSSGNAYDDIRVYLNNKYPLGDMDGDGQTITYDRNGYASPLNGNYSLGGEQSLPHAAYYDLWASDLAYDLAPPVANYPGTATIYDLGANPMSNNWFKEIALKMNVPPSTTTQNFGNTGSKTTNYYIQIPFGSTSKTMSSAQRALLPTGVFNADANNDGVYTNTEKGNIPGGGATANLKWLADGPDWVLDAGTTFYDPSPIASQGLFGGTGSFNDAGGVIGGMNMNSKLVGPPGAPDLAMQDISSASPGTFPPYQIGFVDSWYEARSLQKRETQIEAAYQAYLDASVLMAAPSTKNPMDYNEMMDQVFNAIDMVGGSGGPNPPGTPPPTPPGTPTGQSTNPFSGLMPYGYYYFPTPAGTSIKHNPVNPDYQVGSEYQPPSVPDGTDPGTVYRLIYDRLALAADPTSIPGGSSGSSFLSGSLPPNPGGMTYPTFPQPAATRDYAGGTNPSNLYTPIPVGAAEVSGTGQPNINSDSGTAGLEDTTHQTPTHVTDVGDISKLFVGRQWDYAPGYIPDQQPPGGLGAVAGDDDVAPVKYDAATISTHLMILPGWWYDGSGSTGDTVGKALVTLSPAIDGLAWQQLASNFGLGRIDDYVNSFMGGPFFHVGGGSDSLGIYDIDGSSTKYSIAAGFGMGVGGIYWGHTSAVGTIGRIEDLMKNSGGGNSSDPGPAFGIMKGSLSVLAGLGAASVDEMSLFPNVGLAGFHFDMNIPIPIPPPVGLSFLNIPMTTYGAVSYDVMTDYMYRYLDAMKHEVVDSLSVYSYATGGGYAMDSYGMRGEYHFTEKTAMESLEKMPDLFGLVPIADMIESAVGLLGLQDYTVNKWNLQEEGVLRGDDRHSMSAGEARELDTGAFFTTAAFMSQFQLNKLDYSYWTSTHQNEEAANLDTLRIVAMTGKEMMKLLNKALFSVAGRIDWDGPWAAITLSILNFMLAGFQQSVNEALMWDLLLHDTNEEGFVTTKKITSSSLKAEGYDFIEDERKLFAYDYEQTAKTGLMNKVVSGGFGSFELPNQVLNGMANTRRYKPYLQGVDGRAGRQGYGNDNAVDGTKAHYLQRHASQAGTAADGATASSIEINGITFTPGDQVQVVLNDGTANGTPTLITLGAKTGPDTYNYTVSGSPPGPPFGEPWIVPGSPVIKLGNNNRYDDNWDLDVGYWDDTGLGDINEVYVRKNRVSYDNTNNPSGINNGLGMARTPTVSTEIDRYVGSHNRIIGRGYDGAVPINLQSFRTGYFANRYFGQYISDTAGNDDMMSYNIDGNVDGQSGTNLNFYMHGGQKTYNRINDYSFEVTTADGTNIQLEREAALAPVFGGGMRLSSINMQDPGEILGASTQTETNELTKTLYEFLRVKADGSNAALVKEYRDAFNLGLLDDMYITGSANAPTGGGVTSSIRIKFRSGNETSATATSAVAGDINLGSYEQERYDEVVGTGTLEVEPGFLGRRSYFQNVNRGIADIYLSSFFAFKRAPKTKPQ